LEELRICSTSNKESAANDNDTKRLDDQNGQESRTSLDAAQLKNQPLNYHSSNEAGDSRQTSHIVVEGIYLRLTKPAEAFLKNLSTLNPTDRDKIAVLVLDCCKMACYTFY
jgi:hypothetical protein